MCLGWGCACGDGGIAGGGRARLWTPGEWALAQASFEGSLEKGETAEALFGLSEASWWLGETEEAVRFGERAYGAFRRSGDLGRAALAAVTLYFHYRVSLGNSAAAQGWLGRAARLVEEFELAPLQGWVLLMRAHNTGDPCEAEGLAREARELARAFGDADLDLCSLSQLGVALVEQGRLEEGGALLDEAMAASLGGECRQLRTVVYTSCNMISACSQVAGIERAAEWIHAGDEFARRYGSPHLYTTCRTYYGTILFETGGWPEAERQLTAALEGSRTAERALHGEALARLAELRLAQGRVEEAEQLLAGFEDQSMLRLGGRGDPSRARRARRRRGHSAAVVCVSSSNRSGRGPFPWAARTAWRRPACWSCSRWRSTSRGRSSPRARRSSGSSSSASRWAARRSSRQRLGLLVARSRPTATPRRPSSRSSGH